MGKLAPAASESEGADRVKRRRRKKDLEELRRNALVAKRNLRSRSKLQSQKSALMKTLNEFAADRKEIEDAVQSQDTLLNRSRIIDDQLLAKPLNINGFFRGGVKGKQLTRPLTSKDRLKEAILKGDALQILQSGGYSHRETNRNSSPSEDNIDSKMKSEIVKIFDFTESSSGIDDPLSIEKVGSSSPVLGGAKIFKKKESLEKSETEKTSKSNASQKLNITKQISKEEKCKRRLFEDENTNVNNGNNKYLNNNLYDNAIRFTSRKSTPENVIYFSEHVPLQDVNNKVNKTNNHKLSPTDPELIKCYIQTCKMIAEKDLKYTFWNPSEDPMEIAKAALRSIYTNTFKDYLNRQKRNKSEHGYHSIDRTTNSSNSEIMLEPDSAITRKLKRINQMQMKNESLILESNSASHLHKLSELEVELNMNFRDVVDTLENNPAKRKQIPSSTGDYSDAEIPSSTKVNVDPRSAKVELKMDAILPERQELIARYLQDVSANNHKREKSCNNQQNEKESSDQHIEREKLFIGDNVKTTYLLQKSTKHVPAILRKNRSFMDCISKEKIQLSIEKCPIPGEISSKVTMQEFEVDSSSKSECTPNCETTHMVEAPKCKHMFMNAKYNQPSRINIPIVQNKKHQLNSVPEKHLFPSPDNKDFALTQSFNISPMNNELVPAKDNHDFHNCRLSQESQNSNGMVRMLSFGDLQDRTNRLTLLSSQGQNCSQQSVGQMYTQEDYVNAHSNFHYQHFEPPNNRATYDNRPCVNFNEMPTTQSFDVSLNYNRDYHPHGHVNCNNNPSYIAPSDYSIAPPNNFSFQDSDRFAGCSSGNFQVCRKQNPPQQHQEALMSCVPVQQQSMCQPVKYVAVEGNRLPQRRPLYRPSDSETCLHTHKTSVPNQQFAPVMKPCYSRDVPSQARYAMSSTGMHMQGSLPQSIISPCFEYEHIHKINSILASNGQRTSLNKEIPALSRSAMNYAPSGQIFVPQQSVPMHNAVNNQRYIGQQMPSPLYSQVGYQHNHYSSSEGYKVNDVYLQQMNRNVHSKRPS